jgi:hypothetical protein
MISILVCSANPVLLKQFLENVEQNIGVEYEFLFFDNQKIGKGICEVYNNLAEKSKYNYLCFVHEDVLIKTKDWGKILLDIFSDEKIGLIGVAGAKYKSKYFSGWFTGVQSLDCAHYTHHGQKGEEKVLLNPDKESDIQKVVCIDGVFMCCRKDVWQNVKFNESYFKGFHFYDIDFSLKAAKLCDLAVTYKVELTHLTEGGDYTNNWVETAINYHTTYKKLLPVSCSGIDINRADNTIIKSALDHLKTYRIHLNNKLRWITVQKLHKVPSLYYSVLKFLLYQPLRLSMVHKIFKS